MICTLWLAQLIITMHMARGLIAFTMLVAANNIELRLRLKWHSMRSKCHLVASKGKLGQGTTMHSKPKCWRYVMANKRFWSTWVVRVFKAQQRDMMTCAV